MTKPHTQQLDNIKFQPIGVFDSGIGGLSIFNKIIEQLPNEKLIYIADTLHAPYGDKSDQEIIDRANIIADDLISRGCKTIVVACNTATVTAIESLRKRLSIPIIGVEPAIKPAALQSVNKSIAILTTQATSTNKRFLSLVNKHKQDTSVHIQACPGLVELIESNQLHSSLFTEKLNSYLNEILDKNIDTIVLGCTHYPFFAKQLKNSISEHIKIMETALPVTEQLKRQLIQYNLLNDESIYRIPFNAHQFLSSRASQPLEAIMCSLTSERLTLLQL